ncbi:MAG: tetratricopeptide repeat protein [Alphaproteobacteria bacterium]|jgi:tetratricopeptide (TPR) repeat protein|nr:tetratricopeptide repeat protein [Alphaproteobacteria bacterium]
MTMTPEPLRLFLDNVPETAQKALIALASAESLTDKVAARLIQDVVSPDLPAERFVHALHYASFIIGRNSEWHIEPEARRWLVEQLNQNPEMMQAAHRTLLQIGAEEDPAGAGDIVPSYLFGAIGQAYHRAALDPEEGLQLYSRAYRPQLTGEQWLLGRLAEEQQETGILPGDAIEPAFLRGMTLYREGNRAAAESYLRRVVESGQRRHEVAIAAHLLGRSAQRRHDRREAERLYRLSLDIGEECSDAHHQAQVLHSLGNLLARRKPDEAEVLLRRSLELEEASGNRHGAAQVLHSLGNLLARRQPDEAEALLRRSLRLGEEIRATHHQAQVLNSLGSLLRQQQRWQEAEDCFQKVLGLSRTDVDKAIAFLGLSQVAEARGDLGEAASYMEKTVEAQERTGRRDLIDRHRTRLAELRRRLGGQP